MEPEKEKGRPGQLAKVSVTARPLPLCRTPHAFHPRLGGEPHDALSSCHDAPPSGNPLARRASPFWRPEVRTDAWSCVDQHSGPGHWPGRPRYLCAMRCRRFGFGTGSRTMMAQSSERRATMRTAMALGRLDMRLRFGMADPRSPIHSRGGKSQWRLSELCTAQ